MKGSKVRSMRSLLFFLSGVVLCASYGCSSVPSRHERRLIGRPTVVYLQRPANLGISTVPPSSFFTRYGVECLMLYGGFVGGFVCSAGLGEIDNLLTNESKEAVADQEILAAHSDELKSLGFNDHVYAMFRSVINGTAWLKGKEVNRVSWVKDETKYTIQSTADSVIYLQSTFTLSPDGTDFYVYAVAGIQKFAPDHPRDIYDLRRREFTFVHKLTLEKPGMTWNEVKAAGHQLREMNSAEAIQAWLDNDGARLRDAYAQDIPKIDAGLKEMLGS